MKCKENSIENVKTIFRGLRVDQHNLLTMIISIIIVVIVVWLVGIKPYQSLLSAVNNLLQTLLNIPL